MRVNSSLLPSTFHKTSRQILKFIRPTSYIQLTPFTQESSTSSLDSLLQRPWTCPLCGVKGLYSVVEKSAHLAECGEEEDEVEEIKKVGCFTFKNLKL